MRAMSDATFITTIVSMCVAFLGAMGLVSQVLGARIGDIRVDIGSLREEMRAGFQSVNARIDEQSGRITRVEQRLDEIAQTVAEHEGRLK
jgi:methyl-accepting chemotaxis protein